MLIRKLSRKLKCIKFYFMRECGLRTLVCFVVAESKDVFVLRFLKIFAWLVLIFFISSEVRSAQLELYCWGRNDFGQVGIGDPNIDPVARPALVDTDDNNTLFRDVFQVSVGFDHTCSVKLDGTVWCWGGNYSGQLGDGSTTDRARPVQITSNLPNNQAILISGGEQHTCAIDNDPQVRQVWCWGSDTWGQLGDDYNLADQTSPAKVRYDIDRDGNLDGDLVNAIYVGSGRHHSCAILMDGSVWCWGRNDRGQVGDGTITTNPIPVAVRVVDSLGNPVTGFVQVVGGWSHTCALRWDGTVWCWGRSGRLGYNEATDTPYVNQPVQISGTGETLTGVVQITAGADHTCALRWDGTVWCWGINGNGQLGDNTFSNRRRAVQVVDSLGNPLTSIVQIGAGEIHSCALRSDGVVFCWGSDENDELGDGPDATDKPYAVRILQDDTGQPFQNIVAIMTDGKGNHTCAVKLVGGVFPSDYPCTPTRPLTENEVAPSRVTDPNPEFSSWSNCFHSFRYRVRVWADNLKTQLVWDSGMRVGGPILEGTRIALWGPASRGIAYWGKFLRWGRQYWFEIELGGANWSFPSILSTFTMFIPKGKILYPEWNMLSIPSGTTETTSASLGDDVSCTWWRWDEPTQKYYQTNQFEPGRSLWCYAPQGIPLDLTVGTAYYPSFSLNLSCSSTPTKNDFWCFNMVGNPFPVTLDVSTFIFTNVLTAVWVWIGGPASAWPANYVWCNTNLPLTCDPRARYIEPFEGFWLRCTQSPCAVTMPYPEFFKPAPALEVKSSPLLLVKVEGTCCGGKKDMQNWFGIISDASDEFGKYDVPEIFSSRSLVHFVETNAGQWSGAWAQNIKSYSKEKIWILEVKPQKTSDVTLTFRFAVGSGRWDIFLEDQDSGTVRQVFDGRSITLTGVPQTGKKLLLVAREKFSRPKAKGILQDVVISGQGAGKSGGRKFYVEVNCSTAYANLLVIVFFVLLLRRILKP